MQYMLPIKSFVGVAVIDGLMFTKYTFGKVLEFSYLKNCLNKGLGLSYLKPHNFSKERKI